MSLYRGNRKSDRKNIKISVNYLTQEGTALPTVDNLIVLAAVFQVRLDDILIMKQEIQEIQLDIGA